MAELPPTATIPGASSPGVTTTQVLTARIVAALDGVSGGAKVLIIDDSRLVRASIIKHLKGVFDYVEAGDGQVAWETIVLDPMIRVVLSDISMPKLDGYQLLEKIRGSSLSRIRNLPVVIISGDEQEAAKAARLGATEFITKGVSTVELLSRLEVLMQLQNKSEALEEAREQPVIRHDDTGLASVAMLDVEAEKMWSFTRRHGIDLTVICVRLDEIKGLPPEAHAVRETIRGRVFAFIAEMLTKAIRREDCIARTADGEFLVAAMGISPTGAIKFATRLSQAVARARVQHAGSDLSITATFGIAAASQTRADSVADLRRIAIRRADMGQKMGGNRVVGMVEEGNASGVFTIDDQDLPRMTIAEALNLIARGRQFEVLPHLKSLAEQARPLLALIEREQAEA
ncbi:MAG TPA: response regulator [Burkholderiaceae bacterium]|nr:response regulator [Burkholderiaceae bacterium]